MKNVWWVKPLSDYAKRNWPDYWFQDGAALGRTADEYREPHIRNTFMFEFHFGPTPPDVTANMKPIQPVDWVMVDPFAVPQPLARKACECGAEKAGCGGHSYWCPMMADEEVTEKIHVDGKTAKDVDLDWANLFADIDVHNKK